MRMDTSSGSDFFVFVEALHNNRLEDAIRLVKQGMDVNQSNQQGQTPLMLASSARNLPVVLSLLENNADPNASDDNDNTPLLLVLSQSKEDPVGIVIVLLEYGAMPNKANNYGWTPLLLSSLFGYTDTVLTLLKHGANPNHFNQLTDEGSLGGYTALHYAATNGHLEVVEALVLHGADINVKRVNPDGTSYPSTPLDCALRVSNRTKDPSMINLLVSLGAYNT